MVTWTGSSDQFGTGGTAGSTTTTGTWGQTSLISGAAGSTASKSPFLIGNGARYSSTGGFPDANAGQGGNFSAAVNGGYSTSTLYRRGGGGGGSIIWVGSPSNQYYMYAGGGGAGGFATVSNYYPTNPIFTSGEVLTIVVGNGGSGGSGSTVSGINLTGGSGYQGAVLVRFTR